MRNPFATDLIAAITQLVEWLAVNQHVTGSSPVGGASFVFVSVFYSRGCFVPVCQQTDVVSLFLSIPWKTQKTLKFSAACRFVSCFVRHFVAHNITE